MPQIFILFQVETFFLHFLKDNGKVVRFGGVSGAFRASSKPIQTIRGIGLGVGSNRIFKVINFSNTKGDALIEVLGKLRAPASNRIIVGNGGVGKLGKTRLHRRHGGVNVVFRRFGLL